MYGIEGIVEQVQQDPANVLWNYIDFTNTFIKMFDMALKVLSLALKP